MVSEVGLSPSSEETDHKNKVKMKHWEPSGQHGADRVHKMAEYRLVVQIYLECSKIYPSLKYWFARVTCRIGSSSKNTGSLVVSATLTSCPMSKSGSLLAVRSWHCLALCFLSLIFSLTFSSTLGFSNVVAVADVCAELDHNISVDVFLWSSNASHESCQRLLKHVFCNFNR